MNIQRHIVSSAFAGLLFLMGCKPDSAVKKAATIDNRTQTQTSVPAASSVSRVDAGQLGTITGTIHFNGKPPARIPIDMSMDPACAMAGENLTEQFVVSGGKLANVFVYIKAGVAPVQANPGAAAVVLDQKGCRYTPHVVGVQQGGSVEVRNSDPTMHNVHTTPANAGNSMIDVSQGPMGQPQTRQFNAPELMLPVRCNNHPWMNAFINVAPNPFFAVSSSDGTFSIRGLPPGNYTLAAVHEKLGEQDIPVTVSPHGTTQAGLTFVLK